MEIFFITKNRFDLHIYGYKDELEKLNTQISIDLQIQERLIIGKTNRCLLRYTAKKAKLVAWYLYKNNLFDLKKYDNRLANKKFENKDDEFLYIISATKDDNRILPNVESEKSLEWCHIIQRQLSYKTQPIFSNKGQTKYYYLYIPN